MGMKRGEKLEWELEKLHIEYHRDLKAKVEKTEPGVKDKGNGRIQYTRKGPVDYIGTINPGRPVVFDAKSCATGTFHLDAGRVPLHQAQCLEAHHIMGAVAFLFVETKDGSWVLPWGRIRDIYWGGGETLNQRALERLGLPVVDYDWLPVVKENLV